VDYAISEEILGGPAPGVMLSTMIDTEPLLRRAVDGTWLALAPGHAMIRFGALGRTKPEARDAFLSARRRIADALARDVSDLDGK
jgi:hypothetical protein